MSITEFKVDLNEASSRVRERKIRLTMWAIVLLMSGITIFSVYGTGFESPQAVKALVWIAVGIVAFTIVGAPLLAARLGLQKLEQDSAFVLTEKELIRKRQAQPDVRIGLDEIKALHQRPGWLVIESHEPQRIMAIPEQVREFEALRKELARHGAIDATPQRSLWGFAVLVGSISCWGLVLLSRDAGVIVGAGAVALLLLAWESARLAKQLHHRNKRLVAAATISLSWVTAILVLYLRVVRAR